MGAEKDDLVNGADDGVVMPENAVGGGHKRLDGAVAGENQSSDEAANPSSDEQVFKSTEIYKTKSQKGGDVFEKEKTKKEKFLEWVKEHKWQSVGGGVTVVVIVMIAVIAIVANTQNVPEQDAEEVVASEESAKNTLAEPNGGDFYYTDCELEGEAAATSVDQVLSLACSSMVENNTQDIWDYIDSVEAMAEGFYEQTQAQIWFSLANELLSYRQQVVDNGEQTSAEFDAKIVELVKKYDDVEQTVASAAVVKYFAEVVGDTKTQNEYTEIYSSRSGESSAGCEEEMVSCG